MRKTSSNMVMAACAVCCVAAGADANFLLPAGAEQRVLIIPGYLTSASHLQILDKQRQQQQQQQAQQQQEEQQLPACPYFRVSFASVDSQAMVEGFARLRAAVDSRHTSS